MKKRNIFWGMIFLLIAACILISEMGYFPGINFFKLVLSIGLIAVLVSSIPHKNFAGILFPLAFLAIIFDEALHITNLTPWPVLGIALFGSIGLSILFPHRHHNHLEGYSKETFSETSTQEYGNTIHSSVTFNSSIKYINSTQFESADLSSSFGSLKVYFDQAKLAGQNASIHAESSFGTIILFVPKDWDVRVNVDTAFGTVEEKGSKLLTAASPIVFLNGEVSFGTLEIQYI